VVPALVATTDAAVDRRHVEEDRSVRRPGHARPPYLESSSVPPLPLAPALPILPCGLSQSDARGSPLVAHSLFTGGPTCSN